MGFSNTFLDLFSVVFSDLLSDFYIDISVLAIFLSFFLAIVLSSVILSPRMPFCLCNICHYFFHVLTFVYFVFKRFGVMLCNEHFCRMILFLCVFVSFRFFFVTVTSENISDSEKKAKMIRFGVERNVKLCVCVFFKWFIKNL